jgi:hypothetical protein
MKKIKIILGLLVILGYALLPAFLLAADINDVFTFTYRLVDQGGVNRMELDRSNAYRGIELTVSKKTSGVSQQFEIIQNVGPGLEKLKNGLVVRMLSQVAPAGGHFDLLPSDMPVSSRRIYQSDKAGTGLVFTLVYGVNNIDDLEPGVYSAQINFILRPIFGSATSQIKQPLFIKVTVSETEGAQPLVEIKTASGSRVISLNAQKPDKQSADILVKINRRLRKAFSIVQVAPPTGLVYEGNQLDYNALNMQTSDIQKGTGLPGKITFPTQPRAIYTSTPSGDADDSFILTYSLGDLSNQKAGRYRCRLQYYLDRQGQQKLIDALDLEVENERVFDIIVTPQDQTGMIEFRNLKPKEPPKISEVLIEVKNNTGKRYQLSQKVFSQLINKDGNVIPPEKFTVKTESIDTKGILQFPQEATVKTGETVLLVSDARGSGDKFKVIYELEIPEVIKGGDYSTRISYSLSEI